MAAAVLLALAPAAAGHGATIQLEQDAGPYHVIFYTTDLITAQEWLRVGFNVTDRATGKGVALEEPMVRVRTMDLEGKVVRDENLSLQQPRDGLVFGDVQVGPRGRINFTLPLPQGSVAWEQEVCQYSDEGFLQCGAQAKGAPLPAALAVLAGLGGAALVARRRRR